MELAESDSKKPSIQNRSILAIDLNEIPSPSSETVLASPSVSYSAAIVSPTSIVRSVHENPTPAEGPPADIPGEGIVSVCGECGRPEARGHVVVCDGCERGFHVECAGMMGRQAGPLDEWLCGDCVTGGVGSKRWPLGRKQGVGRGAAVGGSGGARLFDMNASPPSDGEAGVGLADCSEEDGLVKGKDSRVRFIGDQSCRGHQFGSPHSYSDFLYPDNGFGFPSASAILTQTGRLGLEDVLPQSRSLSRSSGDVEFSSQLERLRSSRNATARVPSWDPREIFLRSLREFINRRHGVLEKGWHVEFKQSKNSCELTAVYCAPDGKIFESMSDVACHLGLVSNGTSLGPEVRNDYGSNSLHKDLLIQKPRKSSRLPLADAFNENGSVSVYGSGKDPYYDVQNDESNLKKLEKVIEVTVAGSEANDGADSLHFNDGLPVQYEDFFILSLGKVDARPFYHDSCQIWPVGYRSCWHDKITGSLFLCDVLDGGDTGPLFKVRRFSCSALPIPYGATVLFKGSAAKSNAEKNELSNVASCSSLTYDEDCNIEMLLSDPCVPGEDDVLSWLGNISNEADLNVHDGSQHDVGSQSERSQCDNSVVGEKIGEFVVDGRSSTSVWSTLSNKLIDACRHIFRQTGCVKLFCKHVENGFPISYFDTANEKKDIFFPLEKFCSMLGSNIPLFIKSDHELDSAAGLLENWMSIDRFGFDVEFVQEIIEQLPGVHCCLGYEPLKRRNCNSTSPTVENGLLLVSGKGGILGKLDASVDGLYKGSRRSTSELIVNPVRRDVCPPAGKPLGSKLSSLLVGDVLEVWELLWRFHEVLGLVVPLSFDELESELISPWYESSYPLDKSERESQEGLAMASLGSKDLNGPTSSSSDVDRLEESSHLFIEMETTATRDQAHASLASSTYSRCTGVALRKAHISVLNVLIGELQMKVAALVDPAIEDFKPRRGRKRDVDSSYLSRRRKLYMLPFNELTWPEMARRFLLAIICMDGNLDSADYSFRECSKVLRCLQGDGGVLCGSLSGVAGIEADALLLAETTRRVCGSSNSEDDLFIIEDDEPVVDGPLGNTGVSDDSIPDWAQALKPVRKLPTNVGTRIRKCVNEALEMGPPEWARKILEHSISKEVYKGNASGPTKKAVLSVLSNVIGESSNQKNVKEQKKKKYISKSDIIMRQCRKVLRHAASADDDKVFCNLLSRNLINLSENDDEGMLGSPAMVSRPLDFRTIDLRLATGAYAGSSDAFLEDVRELWNTVCTAHADQPDMVQLAETLSQNFESLYEQEVVPLLSKLKEYTESKCLSAEAKKEIGDILASTSEMPKAPWDEGVCKVCGIDKDDDSVLLCDTCDAEYHTYCLSPPLARIPEGNWYCPSCASEGALKVSQLLRHHNQKKNHGEAICAYLEELARLASTMEGKEYWDLFVDERASLLKFICDELLNSTQIRQHIEQCAEMCTDLQQKLRLLSSEGRSLKLREDIVLSKAAKMGLNIDGEAFREELQAAAGNHNNSPPDEDVQQEVEAPVEPNVLLKAKYWERNESSSNQFRNPEDGKEGQGASNCQTSENGGDCESSSRAKMLESGEAQEELLASQITVPPSHLTESQAHKHELNAVRRELSSLQQSMVELESELLKFSLRMEFLGSDSCGRFYWGSAKPGVHPSLVVDGTMAAQSKKRKVDHRKMARDVSDILNLTSHGLDSNLKPEGSRVPSSFGYDPCCSKTTCSQWFSYQSDAEVGELVRWLSDSDPREKDLKDSILHWQKVRLNDSIHSRNQSLEQLLALSRSSEKADSPNLATKAVGVLEKKYGPCSAAGDLEKLKKRSRKAKVINNGKFYRCICLEPIWPSKNHCVSCHRTFMTTLELDGHTDCRSVSGGSAFHKRKQTTESLRDLGFRKCDTHHGNFMRDRGKNEAASGSTGTGLIRFQNEGLMCPYKFEDICSKFVTNDSVKELVQGIGLIGSGGIPSFVTSESPYLSDPALTLVLPQDGTNLVQSELNEKDTPAQDHAEAGVASVSNAGVPAMNKLRENPEGNQVNQSSTKSHQRIKKISSSSLPLTLEASCIIPESSLRPLVGRPAEILRQLKLNLLDMEAALPEEARRPSRIHWDRRLAWYTFVKAAETIFEMVQATIFLEDMIKTEYLRNEWWYWSSLSAAAKTSTLSALALRIYALDNVILYEKSATALDLPENSRATCDTGQQAVLNSDSSEKSKLGSRRSSKKRKEADS